MTPRQNEHPIDAPWRTPTATHRSEAMRSEVSALVALGTLPTSKAELSHIRRFGDSLAQVESPVSDEEARELVRMLPANDDDCFGMAWTLIHLIESAPSWPIQECLSDGDSPWIAHLRRAARNAGHWLE